MTRLILLVLLSSALAAKVRADGLQDARAAIRAGEYDRAASLVLPLAKAGDSAA